MCFGKGGHLGLDTSEGGGQEHIPVSVSFNLPHTSPKPDHFCLFDKD